MRRRSTHFHHLGASSITIRKLDESLKAKLRVRAATHGRSMEEEAREILKTELAKSPVHKYNLAESIRRRNSNSGA